jgi:hypothetical protein
MGPAWDVGSVSGAWRVLDLVLARMARRVARDRSGGGKNFTKIADPRPDWYMAHIALSLVVVPPAERNT